MHVLFVQEVVAPVLYRRELALLNELPHSDGSYAEYFSRAFGRDEVHQA